MKTISLYLMLILVVLFTGCGDRLSAFGKVQQFEKKDLVFMVRHLSTARKASFMNKQLVKSNNNKKAIISDYDNYHFFDFRIQFKDNEFLEQFDKEQAVLEKGSIGENIGLLPFYLRDEFRKSFYLQYKNQRIECILINALPMNTDETSITYSLTFLDREFENQKNYFKDNVTLVFENKAFSELPILFEYKAEILNQA